MCSVDCVGAGGGGGEGGAPLRTKKIKYNVDEK